MKLNQLFGSVPAIEIGGLAIDSRKVKPGDMYFCLEGMVNDGHAFAADAVKAGAVCIVHAKDLDEMPEGAVYVNLEQNEIRTAFSSDEFEGALPTLIEEMRKNGLLR